MPQPLISVMIGVYNAERYLAEAIESVFAQSYRPLELIVVDDGSDDGSGDIARGYGDGLSYARQENAGNGSARNHAVRLASGELFAFLDADDRFLPEKPEHELAARKSAKTSWRRCKQAWISTWSSATCAGSSAPS